MFSWIVSTFLLPTVIRALGHPKYECGEHGRFEYCIDGIPGCIVGCHCHPGYYFDTETKICEPNAKLVEDYRRLYSAEPTRVPLEAYSLDTENGVTPTTTLQPIDSHVENIAKDADDLGDWLYNQFFKTIENQVINKTETEKPPTRRSESGPGNFSEPINKNLQKKSGRRKEGKLRKKFKVPGRKDKRKKEDLRRKLLRISEDDSLFDSSESQDTSDDSSDESESSDTSDSEGTSDEHSKERDGGGGGSGGGKHNHDKDREHGHRKILMINKKPKPPLPSFIFLPNFETPFYPPIGLPPPVVPMYPMIPVPPMPPFPYPGPTPEYFNCSSTPGNQKTETTTKNEKTVATEKPDDNPSEKPSDDTTTAAPDDATSAAPDEATTAEPDTPSEAPSLRNQKNKKSLRLGKTSAANAKMKKKPKHNRKKPITPHIPDPFLDMYSPQDFLMKDFDKDNSMLKSKQLEDVPGHTGGDVDFKYLAQLIHKMGPNDTNKNDDMKLDMLTPLRRSMNRVSSSNYYPAVIEEETRRNFGRPDRNLERPDDSYYTKLGQQIAFLIRNIDDSNGRRSEQVSYPVPNLSLNLPKRGPSLSNQDLNQGSSLLHQDSSKSESILGRTLNPYLQGIYKNVPPSSQPILYENYAPRSYWERSVRSLFNHFHHYPEVLDSRIDNLYKLESRLILVASTERPLSLSELENVLTVMAKAKTQLQKHTNDMIANETGDENLNVNLLPQHMEMKTSDQNDNTFHRSTKMDTPIITPIITKEIHINSDEMALDKDEVTNFKFPSNIKKVTNLNVTPNKMEVPNVSASPTKIQSTNITPNKKQLANINVTPSKTHVTKFSMSPYKNEQTNFTLSNFALKTFKNELIFNTINNDLKVAPIKKELTIFNFIPNLKGNNMMSSCQQNNSVTKRNKDQQQVESRSMINNVRRNLQGVLLNNFRNIPASINKLNFEVRKHNNDTHNNVNDILKLQRLTTNNLQEIINTHNHRTKVTWLTPKIAIPNPDRPLLQPSSIRHSYRKTSTFPSNRRIFIEKPMRFQLPLKTQVFSSRPQSFFDQDDKGSSYFRHHLNIFD